MAEHAGAGRIDKSECWTLLGAGLVFGELSPPGASPLIGTLPASRA